MFHKSMNMNRKGAASLITNLFVVHWGGCRCVVKSCLLMVASGQGLRLYLEKHLTERERRELESLHRSVQVKCSCQVIFVVFLVFVLSVNVYLFWHKNLDRTHGAKLRIKLTPLTQKKKKKTRGAKLRIQLKSNWIFSPFYLLLLLLLLLLVLIVLLCQPPTSILDIH